MPGFALTRAMLLARAGIAVAVAGTALVGTAMGVIPGERGWRVAAHGGEETAESNDPEQTHETATSTRSMKLAREAIEQNSIHRQPRSRSHAATVCRSAPMRSFVSNYMKSILAQLALGEERFCKPAYLVPRGWISIRLELDHVDWDDVEEFLAESYDSVRR